MTSIPAALPDYSSSIDLGTASRSAAPSQTTLVRELLASSSTSNVSISLSTSVPPVANMEASPELTSSHSSGLSSKNKVVLGGVLGGFGGLILLCIMALLLLSLRKRKQRPQTGQGTPQRMVDASSPGRSLVNKFQTSSGRAQITPIRRNRQASEPQTPSGGGFQVLSGKKLTGVSPGPVQSHNLRRSMDSYDSSTHSIITNYSRRLNRVGTPTSSRGREAPDVLGRSHRDGGSTVSHMSRFIERLEDT